LGHSIFLPAAKMDRAVHDSAFAPVICSSDSTEPSTAKAVRLSSLCNTNY